jgi:hypothetical protein
LPGWFQHGHHRKGICGYHGMKWFLSTWSACGARGRESKVPMVPLISPSLKGPGVDQGDKNPVMLKYSHRPSIWYPCGHNLMTSNFWPTWKGPVSGVMCNCTDGKSWFALISAPPYYPKTTVFPLPGNLSNEPHFLVTLSILGPWPITAKSKGYIPKLCGTRTRHIPQEFLIDRLNECSAIPFWCSTKYEQHTKQNILNPSPLDSSIQRILTYTKKGFEVNEGKV